MVWLNMGEILRVNAKKFPNKLAVKDIRRSLNYSELNDRVNRLGNGLSDMGLQKGDKVGILLYNNLEFIETYCALAKIGVIAVPINFRYVGKDIEFVLDNSDAKAMILGEEFVETINPIRQNLKKIPKENFLVVGEKVPRDFIGFEKLINKSSNDEPKVKVDSKETWILLYTSGTTGVPKGVVRSHESYIAFYLINDVDFGFTDKDYALILMPLFHVNSTFYAYCFLYIGGSVYIHRSRDFNPEELLSIIDKERVTFSSMIPTHYNLILNLPDEVKNKYDMTSITSILCSSAPVRKQTKLDIMDFLPNVRLFEAYGSTEAGLVTLLKPEDQLKKLGSIGKECSGMDIIRLLDENGNEVKVGEVGELYSKGPMMFDEYYKLPGKTKSSFIGAYFSAGDLASMDEEGYYSIVDRKDNMIITGGEHVYPSEVEEVISQHPSVFDVAVIAVPHDKWGEAVKAVVILKKDKENIEKDIIDFCRGKMAGFKKPKSVEFIKASEMPRTSTGKILHRELRTRFSD